MDQRDDTNQDIPVKLSDNLQFEAAGAGQLRQNRRRPATLGRAAEIHRSPRRPESSRQPIWAAERKKLLIRIFNGIERKTANGLSISRAIRAAARRWEGKGYKSAPGRAVNFSEQTLERLYYSWRNAGRDASVLDLHYVAGGSAPKVTPALPALLKSLCLDEGAQSFAAALRVLRRSTYWAGTAPVDSSILRHVPRNERAALRNVFKQRHALKRTERKARAVVAEAPETIVEGGAGI